MAQASGKLAMVAGRLVGLRRKAVGGFWLTLQLAVLAARLGGAPDLPFVRGTVGCSLGSGRAKGRDKQGERSCCVKQRVHVQWKGVVIIPFACWLYKRDCTYTWHAFGLTIIIFAVSVAHCGFLGAFLGPQLG